MNPQRNPHQKVRSESSSNYRYKQIRSYKNRINELRKALQSLVDEMQDPKKIEHYQQIIDKGVKKFRPFKKTSKFRGVSWHAASEQWRSRIHVEDEEIVDYHDTEFEAAMAYDEKAKKYFPDRPWYKNFLDPDETEEDVKPPKNLTVPEKRKIIGQHLEHREIRAINQMGLGYFNKKHCEIAIRYIEKKKDITIG